jgi:hypothetical protein
MELDEFSRCFNRPSTDFNGHFIFKSIITDDSHWLLLMKNQNKLENLFLLQIKVSSLNFSGRKGENWIQVMANDREVLKVVWEGKVPVKFIADEDKDLEDQDVFFLLIPRVSYLPLVTDKVKWLTMWVEPLTFVSLAGQEAFPALHRRRGERLVLLQWNSLEMAFPHRAVVRSSSHGRCSAHANQRSLQEIPRRHPVPLSEQVRIEWIDGRTFKGVPGWTGKSSFEALIEGLSLVEARWLQISCKSLFKMFPPTSHFPFPSQRRRRKPFHGTAQGKIRI